MREFLLAFGVLLIPAVVSAQVYSIKTYGALPDGSTLCTVAIQKAVDECSRHVTGLRINDFRGTAAPANAKAWPIFQRSSPDAVITAPRQPAKRI